MKGILFDLDGVIYQNGKAISGAADTIAWVQQNEIPHLFVTNTSSKPRQAIIDKLDGFGIVTNAEHILTPPLAATNWLKEQFGRARIALYVADSTQQDFAGHYYCSEHADDVDAVIVGDLGENWNFERMNHAFNQLIACPQAQLIALGLTRYWKTGSGLQLDVGPFVKALEYAAGKEALVCGKPSASFFQTAANQLKRLPGELMMIGDDIKGDIDGAQQAGLNAMQVRTGKFQASDLQQGITPDAIIDSIADLPDWWNSQID